MVTMLSRPGPSGMVQVLSRRFLRAPCICGASWSRLPPRTSGTQTFSTILSSTAPGPVVGRVGCSGAWAGGVAAGGVEVGGAAPGAAGGGAAGGVAGGVAEGAAGVVDGAVGGVAAGGAAV